LGPEKVADGMKGVVGGVAVFVFVSVFVSTGRGGVQSSGMDDRWPLTSPVPSFSLSFSLSLSLNLLKSS